MAWIKIKVTNTESALRRTAGLIFNIMNIVYKWAPIRKLFCPHIRKLSLNGSGILGGAGALWYLVHTGSLFCFVVICLRHKCEQFSMCECVYVWISLVAIECTWLLSSLFSMIKAMAWTHYRDSLTTHTCHTKANQEQQQNNLNERSPV